ncbi:MAG: hypothetical protein R3C11_22820 [Planctomycetaceae bacterium]
MSYSSGSRFMYQLKVDLGSDAAQVSVQFGISIRHFSFAAAFASLFQA